MHLIRFVPRPRFGRHLLIALFALFTFTNVSESPFTRVFAPVAAKAIALEERELIPSDIPSSGDRDLDLLIYRAGMREGVDPRLLHAVIWQESKYKVDAISHAGARGLMQLMPATAKRFKCEDRSDSAQNVNAGAKYLRWLLKRFDGNVTLALAGYNAGEGSVDKYDGVPPFGETQKYVRIITGRYGKNYHPLLTPEEARDYFKLMPVEIARAN
jgi:soluble lytic murein transglycosylase-like protein